MNNYKIDQAISEALKKLHEEKYKLRIFELELMIRVDANFGVEETLQDIRSIGGVTVVTALDSLFRKDSKSYMSHIKIKFHPRSDNITPKTYMMDHLLPVIRGNEIPGCKIIRVVKPPQQIN